ncbi:hypothetical protein CWI42_100460 [Ordospora colligata]|uniref:CMP/dCMP-type deaminase domain-containing protein n=1 Tax=Ordospora colligata OC4 TaxID=1354746 RepID=A0A0B2UJ30_9MICR|nr:uncharacterized protein M896_100460 [Ordospora colligata OC4]KHN69062.1 hypothetical protein M896_100460 [Ordospora colligata OC4]TBU14343.1 hypothetical protein CWI40_100470 [Ordospora colligata]TBU14408.1 hypothetical protein CWI41_100470 [Ordospora colligata]TBU17969.1 hypothetical protein CWI42_100460 [Ordospora colligata]
MYELSSSEWIRLKTAEEERSVELMDGYAIRTLKQDIKQYLRFLEYRSIPLHLKRIKASGTMLLVLVDLIDGHDPIENVRKIVCQMVKNGFGGDCACPDKLIEIVCVPKFQPITNEQYHRSALVWPCNKLNKAKESLDTVYIQAMMDALSMQHYNTDVKCSKVCLIANGCDSVCIHCDTDDILGHSIFKAVDEVSKSQLSYLCTGLDVFLLNEPCLSCSMALVHGRIRRVFFVNQNANGPFSLLKMNYNKNLNHRYPVYFMSRPE